MKRARLAAAALPLLGIFCTLGTALAVATTKNWPAQLPLHLALYLGAALPWLGALAALGRLPRTRIDGAVIAIVALLARAPAWIASPAHSDDAYRYAWDGRVARAGENPYRYAPAAPELSSLRKKLAAETGTAELAPLPEYERTSARATDPQRPWWARINNADLPTIYPPGAQLLFRAAASLPLAPIASIKLLSALGDLAVLALLALLLRRRGLDARWAIAWGWSPLVAIEFAQNAHLDAVPIALLVGALWAWEMGRPTLAGALLGGATAIKWVTAPLLVSFRRGRTWAAAIAVMIVCGAPFLDAGGAIAGLGRSTGEFARRWRGNDGVYAAVQALTDRAVCGAIDAPHVERDAAPCDRAIDLWPHWKLAALVTGRTYRAAIYPDELSAFAARALVGMALAILIIWVVRRRMPPLDAGEWILGALLLTTPALHPWYGAWMLPLAALKRRSAWLALAALLPLGYVPLCAWLVGGPWRDPIWTRALEHGACVLLIAWPRLRPDRI